MYIQPLFWILTVTCFILVSGRAEGAKEVAQQSSSEKNPAGNTMVVMP